MYHLNGCTEYVRSILVTKYSILYAVISLRCCLSCSLCELYTIPQIKPTDAKHRHAKRVRVIFLVIGSRSIRRTVHSNDLVKILGGCDVQQEGNWKSIICKYNVTCTSVMVR